MSEAKLNRDGVFMATMGFNVIVLLAVIDLVKRSGIHIDIEAETQKLKDTFSRKPENIYARPQVERAEWTLNKGGQGIPYDILSYLRRNCGYSDEEVNIWWSNQEADSKLDIPSNCN